MHALKSSEAKHAEIKNYTYGMQDTFLNILTMELSKQSDQAMGSNISTAFQANYAILKTPQ